ncbi:MAG TPA: nucleoside hydrolase [Patescibacteria group bacterium]|nr:nucleoside hydrolase [Patescibacteria group bacterium]
MKTLQRPLIVDTDPGHDDVMAILLAVKSQRFDIQALTTVAGNSTIENVTKNAAYTLDLLQRRDIPIYSGAEKPLKRKLVQAVVHGISGLAGADTSKTVIVRTNDAAKQIQQIVRQHKKKITILALGPLTNIAKAFQNDPALPSLIQEIVIMGGAIDVPGNKNRVAEFNMFVDPEAADIVFKTNVKKTLIPIDVCSKTILLLSDFQKLQGTSFYSPIMSMMKHFIQGLTEDEGVQGALVYDAVAAYYLLNPKAFTLVPMDIVIETKGEHTFGMTVAEKRAHKKMEYNTLVAMDVDKKAFVKDFLAILQKQI